MGVYLLLKLVSIQHFWYVVLTTISGLVEIRQAAKRCRTVYTFIFYCTDKDSAYNVPCSAAKSRMSFRNGIFTTNQFLLFYFYKLPRFVKCLPRLTGRHRLCDWPTQRIKLPTNHGAQPQIAKRKQLRPPKRHFSFLTIKTIKFLLSTSLKIIFTYIKYKHNEIIIDSFKIVMIFAKNKVDLLLQIYKP